MVFKKSTATLVFMLVCILFGTAQTEFQYKYKTDEKEDLLYFLAENPQWQNYGIDYHSVYIYSDIYLDTKDKLLYKNGYSLRFRRKRIWPMNSRYSDSTSFYVMQLKSEMQGDSVGRLEVEEENLRFHSVCLEDSTVSLVKHLDRFFADSDSSAMSFPDSNSLFIIKTWLQRKSGGIVLPILEIEKRLKEKHPDFDAGDLEIAFSGLEMRCRFHLYYKINEQNSESALSPNRIRDDEMPPFFLAHPEYIYIAEISHDNATFWKNWEPYSDEDKSIRLHELEIENKYFIPEKGNEAIKWLEEELRARFALQEERNSKYRQCVEKR